MTSHAYVFKELFQSYWRVAQVALIGGDVSASSLGPDSAWAKPMYDRIMRLTNYANGPAFGTFCHGWHVGNRVFARDLAMTLEGRIDRHAIPTRRADPAEGLLLQDAPRPTTEIAWLESRNDEVRR